MLQNLHTHSLYDDGRDSIDDMVQTALEKGFDILGFSGHGYNPADDCSMSPEKTEQYRKDIQAAKERYGNRIRLWCGIEQDAMHPLDLSGYDYAIGSVHYIPVPENLSCACHTGTGPSIGPVDYSREVFDEILQKGYQGDIKAMTQAYYDCVIEMIEANPEIDIIGHLDLISKYNEDESYFHFDAPWYLQAARKAALCGIEHGKIFEINTGAIARGYRTKPYPDLNLLTFLAENQARICISSDCHNRENLALQLESSAALAKKAGFDELWILGEHGFEAAPIDAFIPSLTDQVKE